MVAAPNPRTWLNPIFVTDAILNAEIRDILRFLLDPPSTILRQTVAQSIPNNTYTAVTFNQEDYDNEATAAYLSGVGMHDPASNPSRVVCQTPGRYLLTGGVSFVQGTGRRGILWSVNGVNLPATQVIQASGTTMGQDMTAKTMFVSLTVGDFVEMKAFQDTGAAMSLVVVAPSQSGMTARWVGL